MKVWKEGDPEPVEPQLVATDEIYETGGLALATHFCSHWLGGKQISTDFDDVYFMLPVLGDFNHDQALDNVDITRLSREVYYERHGQPFDLNGDERVDHDDHRIWVHDLKHTWLGDANLDGEFNSSDMVQVFTKGTYEAIWESPLGPRPVLADWEEGDWNADRVFTSSDMVAAFADGGYEKGPPMDATAVPEPTSIVLLATGLIGVAVCRRRPQP